MRWLSNHGRIDICQFNALIVYRFRLVKRRIKRLKDIGRHLFFERFEFRFGGGTRSEYLASVAQYRILRLPRFDQAFGVVLGSRGLFVAAHAKRHAFEQNGAWILANRIRQFFGGFKHESEVVSIN